MITPKKTPARKLKIARPRGRDAQVYAMVRQNPYLSRLEMAQLIGDGISADGVKQSIKRLTQAGYIELIPAHYRVLVHVPLSTAHNRKNPYEEREIKVSAGYKELLQVNERWATELEDNDLQDVTPIDELSPPAPLPKQSKNKGLIGL